MIRSTRNWDNNEDQAWRQYLSDHQKKYHDYSRGTKSEQSGYWNQRHQDGDQNRRPDGENHQYDGNRPDGSRRSDDNPR